MYGFKDVASHLVAASGVNLVLQSTSGQTPLGAVQAVLASDEYPIYSVQPSKSGQPLTADEKSALQEIETMLT